MNCPLCDKFTSFLFFQKTLKKYYRCENCHLIFLGQELRLSLEDEKEVYDLHENSPIDLNYRKFLSRLFIPMAQRLKPFSEGLDFGCGNGPTLSVMFEEDGHKMALYDKIYTDHKEVFSNKYDFITASEVVEHLYYPGVEIKSILGLLKPGGTLGIMTKLARDRESFSTWHYINDPTHVCFFSKDTFEWMAYAWSLRLEFFGADVIFLSKLE